MREGAAHESTAKTRGETMNGREEPTGLGEKRPGTYALLLRSAASGRVALGRHGVLAVRCGWYVYVGSARGPGGLRARLAHHLRPARHPHWHIDYLRQLAAVQEIWVSYEQRADEHSWARVFGAAEGGLIPADGFGSSDCDCRTHLFFFRRRPARAIFDQERLAGRPKFVMSVNATRSVALLQSRRLPGPRQMPFSEVCRAPSARPKVGGTYYGDRGKH